MYYKVLELIAQLQRMSKEIRSKSGYDDPNLLMQPLKLVEEARHLADMILLIPRYAMVSSIEDIESEYLRISKETQKIQKTLENVFQGSNLMNDEEYMNERKILLIRDTSFLYFLAHQHQNPRNRRCPSNCGISLRLQLDIPVGHCSLTWVKPNENIPNGHTAFSWKTPSQCNFLVLIHILKRLRKIEVSRVFQSTLLADQLSLVQNTLYTRENFAYGSTPYSTWFDVFQHPCLVKAIERCRLQNLKYVVFGSSTGFMVFYGALTFGISSIGYEILPFLFDISTNIQRSYHITNTSFYCLDFLQASLKNVGVLVLTSQCWDPTLQQKLQLFLAEKLPLHTIVVDYRPSLSGVSCFTLLKSTVGKVSWNEKHPFFIYSKIA